jgi:6-phosphofructokinase 1
MATDLVHQQKFGRMVALQGNQIVDVPIIDAVGTLKTVDMNLYAVSEVFFG